MKVFAYWAARSALFIAAWAGLRLLPWPEIIAILVAFVVAWLVSYLLLPTMRVAAGQQLDGWIETFQARHHRDDAVEDAEASS
ncbi:MAG: hypothetical protein CVT64_03505 [Actinobacteria bacterium HGW-Actinobacteria-4]|nr:MAG: hypothetical protein CVT64_03505 [Actinobacteria bacterium HGW-Actinobacteria-4]